MAEKRSRVTRSMPHLSRVYRMIDAECEVLYVGKPRTCRSACCPLRPAGWRRGSCKCRGDRELEFVSTAPNEALLLEANLIKRLRPRYNVLLRDDKSFPYILITASERAPQILKHRGARNQPGAYFGPFASAWAVNRTITALERAFLLRSCSDAVFDTARVRAYGIR